MALERTRFTPMAAITVRDHQDQIEVLYFVEIK